MVVVATSSYLPPLPPPQSGGGGEEGGDGVGGGDVGAEGHLRDGAVADLRRKHSAGGICFTLAICFCAGGGDRAVSEERQKGSTRGQP